MPLIHGTSKRSLEKNIAAEIRSGRPRKQAVAIAYAVMREAHKKLKATHRRR